MPRKAKTTPIYRLEVNAPVNGPVHKADIRAFDAEGKLAYTDRANLTEATERHKAAQRMARALKPRNAAKVESDLEQAWTAGVEVQHRKQEAEQSTKTETPPSENRPGAAYFVDKGAFIAVVTTGKATRSAPKHCATSPPPLKWRRPTTTAAARFSTAFELLASSGMASLSLPSMCRPATSLR